MSDLALALTPQSFEIYAPALSVVALAASAVWAGHEPGQPRHLVRIAAHATGRRAALIAVTASLLLAVQLPASAVSADHSHRTPKTSGGPR